MTPRNIDLSFILFKNQGVNDHNNNCLSSGYLLSLKLTLYYNNTVYTYRILCNIVTDKCLDFKK